MPNTQSIYGYEIRSPHPTEETYFKTNPVVSGMAAEDGRIVLNPYSKLSEAQRAAVTKNEAARLWLREHRVQPSFRLTPEQLQAFQGTPYSQDELALKHSILSRFISGDPSAGAISEEQRQWGVWLRDQLEKRNK